ncbi:GAF domain-containing protein [Paracrocinitomix mangrovi]|uniref:GAF domain-containing protein n=1 Tax=Paracrocinitomix mangrovi TaxID=2862509 RepID=UPI001C8EF857|nr:GAF domain-containing protein [Paracrocinitomix mangrovi]UKN00376.1 GAF domain-containing protein [Paracrocinitomix mangrovi]
MAEELKITSGSRQEVYESLLPQIKSLIEPEDDFIANCANIAAALRQTFGFFWVGFYFVKNQEELVLGPFQGDIACTRIRIGKGVCGTAWEKEETIVVEDVEAFPGHIACSALSKSEIVVPIFKNNVVVAVLDIDSDKLNDFGEVDKIYLEKLALIISEIIAS